MTRPVLPKDITNILGENERFGVSSKRMVNALGDRLNRGMGIIGWANRIDS